MILTSVDILLGLLLLCAGAVLVGSINGKTSLGAGCVQVATIVHGLLERVTLPAEHVVAMGCWTTSLIC